MSFAALFFLSFRRQSKERTDKTHRPLIFTMEIMYYLIMYDHGA